ncbi:hypothetical protein MICCA_570007 [Microcystis aeruginosa PCC 9432]|jgi:hypothetical protein|uniref:Uncharacterized protein n=4 Tax=Microcystis aeruginosa TaxID=1126 RepID=A0A2H6BUS4_MICAE|nr:hypothetical protein O53_4905 [Microcystis aeruginosa TAIHU98]QHU83409.1 hypothetical protein D3800_08810 [Microcystis aeruginosa NIES-298]ROI08764.1 hypothetical protein ED562_06640 [Microcystis aeruginosa FACHB-524]TRT99479.1 MAG: hypothetical protein EWV62_06225 [Microcystis aeruginosa Ma_OC_LR_19540900_S633]TYT71635.1 hypothetical protein FXO09_08525 [Microcystis aeruginosa KLA2]CCH94950.1 hypothetical protein MICCA_570007 [Microcystis aeruginosa PCC 9432]CCI08914.1 hypothetical protei
MVLSELAPTAVTSVLSDLSTPTEVKKFPAQNNDLIYFCELDSSNKLIIEPQGVYTTLDGRIYLIRKC